MDTNASAGKMVVPMSFRYTTLSFDPMVDLRFRSLKMRVLYFKGWISAPVQCFGMVVGPGQSTRAEQMFVRIAFSGHFKYRENICLQWGQLRNEEMRIAVR